jgi:hypothetical protein
LISASYNLYMANPRIDLSLDTEALITSWSLALHDN